jgi:hypothetical protein
MRHLVPGLVTLSLLAILGCASSPAPPPQPGPRGAFAYAPPPSEGEQELLDAQIQLTRTLGMGLLTGATMIAMTTTTCPTPSEVIKAGLLSADLSSRDAWGTPFRVDCSPEMHISVRSAGPDLSFDSPDDLVIDDR